MLAGTPREMPRLKLAWKTQSIQGSANSQRSTAKNRNRLVFVLVRGGRSLADLRIVEELRFGGGCAHDSFSNEIVEGKEKEEHKASQVSDASGGVT